MNVLVTGGAGYIGSHATRRLLDAGHTVVVVDDLSHGHKDAVDARATLIVANIGDGAAMETALRDHAIDAVLHFAAVIEVAESVADPAKYYKNNVVCAVALFDAMRRVGVKKLVFSSTAAVYGSPQMMPIPEDHPRLPINPYGRSKHMIELILEDYAAVYQFGVVALRYFNVAGASPDGTRGEAHEPETHLIPRVLQVAAGIGDHPAVIYGTDYPTPDGTCVRDYIHIEDTVKAHLLALEFVRPGRADAFNLGSETGFSVRQVIDTIGRVVGRKIPVLEHPRRAGDPATLIAGSARIRAVLGFKLDHPELEEIVQHAWNWHKANPQGYATPRPPAGPAGPARNATL